MTSMKAGQQSVFTTTMHCFDVLQRVYMRLSGYVSPVKDCQTVFGAKIRCRTKDFIQRRIRFFGVFEHNLTNYTIENLKRGDVFLDIGANIGYFTLLASKSVGDTGKVISIEANPLTYRALKQNVEQNRCVNVELRNIAATSKPCRVSIRLGDVVNSGTSSISNEASEGDVEGLPFDAIAAGDMGRIRFIKIDIEGSEAPVLDAILHRLDELPRNLIVASEISENSTQFVRKFAEAGFTTFGLQNIYSIDYYLMRSYMKQYGEGDMVAKFPVAIHDPRYRDYVFERKV